MEPRGEGSDSLRGEERERVERRTTQPWEGAAEPPGSGSLQAGADSVGSAEGDVGGSGGDVRERAVEDAQRALRRGKEAAREQAESMLSTGSEHAARWIECASEALRQGAASLERDETARMAARYVRHAAGSLDAVAETLRHDDLGSLVQRVESLARRRPAVFLGGAAAAGLAIGRFLRSSRARRGMECSSGSLGARGEGFERDSDWQLDPSFDRDPRGEPDPGWRREGRSRGLIDEPHIAAGHAPPIAVDPAVARGRGRRRSP